MRRDNIGDLVCTTPLFRALREKFPDAVIAAYVNSYNLPVLEGNPDVNAIHAYTKAKHRARGTSLLALYWRRARQLLALRAEHFDDIIIAEPGYAPRLVRLARLLAPGRVVGFARDDGAARGLDIAVKRQADRPLHETEDVFRLLHAYGIDTAPPAPRIVARAREVASENSVPVVGLHISARKPSQRWPAENFVALARQLHRDYGVKLKLFWSPGDERNPLHPGDDAKAQAILSRLEDVPIEAIATPTLRILIDALAQCDTVICSDGGAMHLAAGLGKPIVCFFGKSDAVRWRPWGVPYELLQKPSHEVADISVEEAVAACTRIAKRQ